MSICEPFDEDHEKMVMQEITKTLDELSKMGYIEVVGMDENGEWLYKATEAGIDYYNEKMSEEQ